MLSVLPTHFTFSNSPHRSRFASRQAIVYLAPIAALTRAIGGVATFAHHALEIQLFGHAQQRQPVFERDVATLGERLAQDATSTGIGTAAIKLGGFPAGSNDLCCLDDLEGHEGNHRHPSRTPASNAVSMGHL